MHRSTTQSLLLTTIIPAATPGFFKYPLLLRHGHGCNPRREADAPAAAPIRLRRERRSTALPGYRESATTSNVRVSAAECDSTHHSHAHSSSDCTEWSRSVEEDSVLDDDVFEARQQVGIHR